tara:strand:+ start:87 stop:428 length:342 start_codon:yes stop_codon:yes gene_type:complete
VKKEEEVTTLPDKSIYISAEVANKLLSLPWVKRWLNTGDNRTNSLRSFWEMQTMYIIENPKESFEEFVANQSVINNAKACIKANATADRVCLESKDNNMKKYGVTEDDLLMAA